MSSVGAFVWMQRLYRWGLPIAAAYLIFLLSSALTEQTDLFNHLEAESASRIRDLTSLPASEDLVIIAMKEESPARLGLRPNNLVRRERFGEMLLALDKAGAKAAMLDYVFGADPGPQSGHTAAQRKEMVQDTANFVRRLESVKQLPITLASLPFELEEEEGGLLARTELGIPVVSMEPYNHILRAPNSPKLRTGSVHTYGTDRAFIGIHAFSEVEETGLPELSAAVSVASQAAGEADKSPEFDPKKGIVRMGSLEWSSNGHGAIWLHYCNPPDAFKTYEFSNVLLDMTDQERAATFGGKIVLIGDLRTSIPKPDYHLTSKGELAGIVIMANMVNTLIRGNSERLQFVHPALLTIWCLLLAGGIIIAWMAGSWLVGLFTTFGAGLLSVNLPIFIANREPILFETITPLLCVALSLPIGIALGRYVPKPREFAGSEKLATIVFFDIKNSTILVGDLGFQEYSKRFAKLIESVRTRAKKLGGDIERTTGDGAILIFSSESGENHPVRALQFVKGCIEADGPEAQFEISFGLETGRVTGRYVWEHGVRSWSSAGMCVNLAARIQSYCRDHEISYAIGPTAAGILAESVKMKQICQVSLKGIPNEVSLFREANAELPESTTEG